MALKSNILLEATRQDLLKKSRKAKKYKYANKNRFEARKNVSVANTVADYSKIDMNTLWKDDILTFDVKVKGETNDYIVTVVFSGVTKQIQENVKNNKNLFNKDMVYNALVSCLNSDDIKINCSCPDFKYRMAYQASQGGFKAGTQETRAAKITNPNNDLGAACKHVLCVLQNAKWIRNIASVVNNYVNYAKRNLENLYAKYIFPKIYGMSYDDAIQMNVFDYDNGKIKDNIDTDEATINLSNAIGKNRGKFQKGSNKNPASQKK